MLTICLVIALLLAVAAAIKWRTAAIALLRHMVVKDYPIPTDDELKESSEYAVRHLFERINKTGRN